jgi:hypothetical protein
MLKYIVENRDLTFVEVAHNRSAYFCLRCSEATIKDVTDVFVGVQVEDAIRHLQQHEKNGADVGSALQDLHEELRLCRSANHHLRFTP